MSLRLRLLLILLVAVLPAVLTLTFRAAAERRLSKQSAAEASVNQARRAAGSVDAAIGAARVTLASLAATPALRTRGDRVLEELREANPVLIVLGSADRSGRVLHATPAAGSTALRLGNEHWFREAIETRRFAAGPLHRDPVTGDAAAWCAKPVHGTSGAIVSVLFAKVAVAPSGESPSEIALPKDGVLVLASPEGQIVWRTPPSANGRDALLPEPLVRAMRERSAGIVEDRRFLRGGRLYAFARHATTQGTSILSVPLETAYANADESFLWSLVSLAFLAIALLAGLWIGEQLIILRPVESLARATRRLSAGDLSARSRLPRDPGEIGEIAGAVAEMASALEQSGSERKEAEQALLAEERRFQALIEHSTDVIFLVDREGTILYASPSVPPMLGYGPGELEGSDGFAIVHPEDIEYAHECLERTLRSPNATLVFAFRLQHKNGEPIWIESVVTNLLGTPDVGALVVNCRDITDRKLAETALREGQERLDGLVRTAMDAIITIDSEQRIILFNTAAEKTFRCPAEDVLGQKLEQFIPADLGDTHDKHVREFMRTGGTTRSKNGLRILTGLRANGEEFPVEATISQTEVGGQQLCTVILRDVTERVRAEEALRTNEAFKTALLEASLDAIVPFDSEGRILDFNPAAERLFGRRREDVLGRRVADMLVPPDLRPTFREFVARSRTADGAPRPARHVEIAAMRADGSEFPSELVVAAIPDEFERPLFAATFRDITGRQQYEQALRTMSLVDDLTGLYNRRGFFTFAEQQVRLADRTRTPVWLLFADVDNLKVINDTYGHQEGDRALVDTAHVLRETFRDSDVIARIAGDEFVVMAVEASDAGAERMIRRFVERLARFSHDEDRPYRLSASIGRARYEPGNPRPMAELLAEGDAAMYESKRERRRQAG